MNGEHEVLTYELFRGAVRELAQTIADEGYAPDAIIAIARGGMPLAAALAYALDVAAVGSLSIEKPARIGSQRPAPHLAPTSFDRESLAGRRVLLVDDMVDSGHTLSLVLELLQATGCEVRSVSLYAKSRTVEEPHWAWRRTDRWIDFPWSVEGAVTARRGDPQVDARADA